MCNAAESRLTQVHYLGDPGRGSVWEETIINCPPHIRLLAMSATIANAHDLGGWISQASRTHAWAAAVFSAF
jgi:superfamily II RNA helicase